MSASPLNLQQKFIHLHCFAADSTSLKLLEFGLIHHWMILKTVGKNADPDQTDLGSVLTVAKCMSVCKVTGTISFQCIF